METSLILIKPDGVQRRLVGRILARFEEKGLQIAGAKLMRITPDLAARHYAAHEGKPFYPGLVAFMTSGPVLALALRGRNAVAVVRKMLGATFGSKAEPGTIRGDFGISDGFNLVHASDSPDTAKHELSLFFRPEEVLDFAMVDLPWVYDASSDLR
jgi:nucleoside-diphosphate kinase